MKKRRKRRRLRKWKKKFQIKKSTPEVENADGDPPPEPPASPTESSAGNYERTKKRMEELLRKAKRKKEAILGRNTQMWKSYGAKAHDRSLPQRASGVIKLDHKPLIQFPVQDRSSRYTVNYGRQGTISHWSRGQNPLAFSSGYNNYAPKSYAAESTMHWSQLRATAMGAGVGY